MKRFKLIIEYDGTPFSGWQRQENAQSIQEEIELAIAQFNKGILFPLYAAGRTDSGVHALGQVAHVDLPEDKDTRTVLHAINFYLKKLPIKILSVEEVSMDFHARFSAKARCYMYKIINRYVPLTLDLCRALHVRSPLNIKDMQEAAKYLLGHHDFTTFRASYCQATSPFRTVDRIDIIQKSLEHIDVVIHARSFLHHQVRNMVGTLLLVGKGKWLPADVRHALEKRNRRYAGPTAPAGGLYFHSVTY